MPVCWIQVEEWNRKWQLVLLTETPRSPLSPRGPLEPGPPCMEREAWSESGSNSKQIPKALKSWTMRNPHRGLSEVTVQWYSRHETFSAAVFPAGIYLLTLLPEPTFPRMVSSSTSLSKGKRKYPSWCVVFPHHIPVQCVQCDLSSPSS